MRRGHMIAVAAAALLAAHAGVAQQSPMSSVACIAAEEGSVEWRDAVTQYEFVRGGISSFDYLTYYDALMSVRGAEARKRRAVAFDIDALGKKRVLDAFN